VITMTITRFEIELFKISMDEAVEIVYKLMARHPEYLDMVRPGQDRFICFMNPKPISGKSKVKIDLYGHPEGIVVRVETLSSPHVEIDPTGYFDRVLRKFMARFREQVLLDDGA
jgi:hypothetical protein